MQRAFVVLGPESSGTHFLCYAFMLSGCYGDLGPQRIDKETPEKTPNIVWRDARVCSIQRAYKLIFSFVMSKNLPFTIVPYESLIFQPRAIHKLLKKFGLTLQGTLHIKNGNAKYYSG